MGDRYQFIAASGSEHLLCLACGVVVGREAQHDVWHDLQDRLIASIQDDARKALAAANHSHVTDVIGPGPTIDDAEFRRDVQRQVERMLPSSVDESATEDGS